MNDKREKYSNQLNSRDIKVKNKKLDIKLRRNYLNEIKNASDLLHANRLRWASNGAGRRTWLGLAWRVQKRGNAEREREQNANLRGKNNLKHLGCAIIWNQTFLEPLNGGDRGE